MRIGLWRLLEPWLDAPRCLPGESPLRLDALGAPVSDYVPFRGMDAATAADLLCRLPGAALSDRQNLAPSLKTLLTACAGADGQVRLCGYGIGPQREDERLSVEALWVADADLQGYEVLAEHSRDCQCSALWERVKERYELDTGCVPDDIVRTRPEWAGEPGCLVGPAMRAVRPGRPAHSCRAPSLEAGSVLLKRAEPAPPIHPLR